ncbi:protocadherin-11 X-linked-like [Mercenaria mercenaria]|uniref:protocadherin-11 X-linked-like n=1 Tax=Mercenaria mercenaria TaxID=6596 RepID=UPI00234E83F4|nr:protocadherin-11 X-linked-like [Mercenaria mercenaria]
MFSGSRTLQMLIKSLCITCLLSLEIKTSRNGIRLKRQTSNTSPSFSKAEYRASIPENQAAGLSVILLTATDPNQGENGKNHTVPKFDKPVYDASVSEAAFDGHLVTTVHASDADSGTNAQINYRFSDIGSGYSDFEIDDASGDIRVANGSKIDREKRNDYTLIVLAVEKGVIPLTGSVEVRIRIEDINDNAPKFAKDELIAVVPENLNIGSTLAVIEAVDPDEGVNANVEYTLEGGLDADKFLLANRPGGPAIIVNRVDLDFESDKKEYYIQLKASSGTLFSRALVIIKVQDVNDNSPVFSVKQVYAQISNDAPLGQYVTHLTATDKDLGLNAIITYNIVKGNSEQIFGIGIKTGIITLERTINYTNNNNFILTVTASDGINFDTSKVYINVTYSNKYALSFLNESYQFNVYENVAVGTSIGKVQAVVTGAAQNGGITYQLLKTQEFTINPGSGEIRTLVQLDREIQLAYWFEVRVSENADRTNQATTTVSVSLIDQNDNPPYFSKSVYEASITKPVTAGRIVTTVRAADADSGNNSKIRYSLNIANSILNDFKIDSMSGVIYIAQSNTIDKESTKTYTMTVLAVDGGVVPCTAQSLVRVKVESEVVPVG